MAELQLPKELATGVLEMDDQHEDIFRQMHEVKSRLMERETLDAESFALVSQLAIDMAMHFAWEEQTAAEAGIPFAEHTREHERIKKFLLTKASQVEQGECNIPALLVYMDRKFETHIVYFDRPFGRQLQAKPLAVDRHHAFPVFTRPGYASAASLPS